MFARFRHTCRWVVLLTGIFATIASEGALADANAANRILERAEADPGNAALIGELLVETDGLISQDPAEPVSHYTKAWLLSHSGHSDLAVHEYAEAIRLDPTFSAAMYNMGVVLADLGRIEEALAEWNAVVQVDPKSVDAFYNAGQVYYNLHQYKDALDRWQKAEALAPDDFGVAKKVLQAANALGDRSAAVRARARVLEIWRTTGDADVKALRDFCFDQRDIGGVHVYAYETFSPQGDDATIYTFKLADKANRVLGTVELDSTASGRAQGLPYVIVFDKGGAHTTTATAFAKLPDYDALWLEVEKTINSAFKDLK